MITFAELHEQNHRIMTLSNVLENLIHDRGMCDNEVTAELFFRYVDEVKHHLDVEDKHLYKELLTHSDQSVNNTARLFLSGSAEIKRIFEKYLRKWCVKQKVKFSDHHKFVTETEEMFTMVQNRIQDETEQLYPLVRKLNEKQAA